LPALWTIPFLHGNGLARVRGTGMYLLAWKQRYDVQIFNVHAFKHAGSQLKGRL